MISELEKADLETEHLDCLRRLAKTDLLVLDDFGLIYLDPDKCRNMFELINAREKQKVNDRSFTITD